jgi:hypothetical protein
MNDDRPKATEISILEREGGVAFRLLASGAPMRLVQIVITRLGEERPVWSLVSSAASGKPVLQADTEITLFCPVDPSDVAAVQTRAIEIEAILDAFPDSHPIADLIYGTVPAGFTQEHPAVGPPAPLIPGIPYCVSAMGQSMGMLIFRLELGK